MLIDIIVKHNQIKELDLDNNNISNLSALFGAFGDNSISHLKEIKLSGNNFSQITINDFGNVLKNNKTLEVLYLASNNITDLTYFLKALETNTNLKKLNLSGNKFNKNSEQIIGAFLLSNNTLTELNLSDNKFFTLRDLSKGLIKNTGLKILFLSRIVFGYNNDGYEIYNLIDQIALFLKFNKTLKELYLSGIRFSNYGRNHTYNFNNNNNINDINYAAFDTCEYKNNNKYDINDLNILVQSLVINNSLEKLDFSKTSIDDKGIKYLFFLLLKNTNLKLLNLLETKITDIGAACLKEYIESNSITTQLMLETKLFTTNIKDNTKTHILNLPVYSLNNTKNLTPYNKAIVNNPPSYANSSKEKLVKQTNLPPPYSQRYRLNV